MNTTRRNSFNLFIGLLIGVSFLVCCAEAVPAGADRFLKISRKDVADQQHQNKTAQIIRRQHRQAPEDDEDYAMPVDENGLEGSGEASGDGIDEGLINPGEEELVPEITDEVGEPEETVVEPGETEENVVDPEETEETVVEPEETEESVVEPEETEETVVDPEETEEPVVEPEEPVEPVEPEVPEEPFTAAPEGPDAAPAYVSIHV